MEIRKFTQIMAVEEYVILITNKGEKKNLTTEEKIIVKNDLGNLLDFLLEIYNKLAEEIAKKETR